MNIVLFIFHLLNSITNRLRSFLYPKYGIYLLKRRGVIFGKNVKIRGKFYLRKTSDSKFIIGDNFVIDSGYNINPLSSNIRASFSIRKKASLIIGNNVGISSSVLLVGNELTIGNNVLIGAGCSIMDTEGHSLNPIERRTDGITGIGKKAKGIHIEDDVWIGSNSMICTGVTIGKCAVIGTNSVVRSSIPPYALAYGNPAKIVSFVMAPKDAFENEKANYSIENRINLQDLKDNYSKYFVDRIKNIKEFIK